ncbi:MAG TPA: hypothetical protein VFE32_11695 [Puia sp.]|jgi:hypothetical protein|nr:hypothetical protein [Puia sp.]
MKNILFLLAMGMSAVSTFGQQQKWHELEGYFQFTANKEQVVRFTARDSVLVVNLLWNNGKLHLLPDTGLSFVSKEPVEGNPIRVSFVRDATGAVNQVKVASSGIWVRVANYTPHVKKQIAHTPDQLQKFIGLYQMKRDTTLYIRLGVDSNTLTIHRMWDGNVIDNLVPESELKYFKVENTTFTLTFSSDPNGQVSQFLINEQEPWIRITAHNIDPAHFKSYEGKYQSATDPDNQIQLIATASGLVLRQLWDKKEIGFDPLTNSFFYNAQQSYPLHIVTDSLGQVKSVLLLGTELFNKIDP